MTVLRGVWSEIAGMGSLDAFIDVQNKLGTSLDVMRFYMSWGGNITGNNYLQYAKDNDKTVILAWHPFIGGGLPPSQNTACTWNDISSGRQDGRIRDMGSQLAAAIAAGFKCLFVWHHEPEDDCPPINHAASCSTSSNEAIQAMEFRKAFNQVRRLFIAAGVPSSAIGVTLEGSTYRGNHGGADLWLPRTAAFIGTDGYNRGGVCGKRWMSFDETFGAANAKAEALGKPLLMEEIGCPEGLAATGPQSKAEWLGQMKSSLAAWPRVFAWCYSHVDAICDYHVDTSAESLAAFKAVL